MYLFLIEYFFIIINTGISLAVQWLRICAFTAGGAQIEPWSEN